MVPPLQTGWALTASAPAEEARLVLQFTPRDLKQPGLPCLWPTGCYTNRTVKFFQTAPLVQKAIAPQQPYDSDPVQAQSDTAQLSHIGCSQAFADHSIPYLFIFKRICRPFYSISVSCGNLNDILTIIYFSSKGP